MMPFLRRAVLVGLVSGMVAFGALSASAQMLVYDPSNYGASQRLARELRRAGSNGIVYDSVRHDGGHCAAGFRPRLFANARQERHLCYVWDGTRIRNVYEKRALG